MSDIAKEYQNPSAVYKLPTSSTELQVEYNNTTCTAQTQNEKTTGYQCADVFLKSHSGYLLVPHGQEVSSIKFFKTVSETVSELLPTPKKEMLMNPIEGDFVDVHGGERDSR